MQHREANEVSNMLFLSGETCYKGNILYIIDEAKQIS